MAAFRELEIATGPVFMLPPQPECVRMRMMTASSSSSVDVVASGEVGPYEFDVVRSDDPDALVGWLGEFNYRVTPEMEPIIDLYVAEGFVFLAMKLRPGQGVQNVEPVKVTYPSSAPMIPLRLTAVAANPNMAVMVWIYADAQATPINYDSMEIPDGDLVFGGGSNYRQLIAERADERGGQAFITEYAGPTTDLAVRHPLLRSMADRFSYVTRLNTVISPEEMTVDPVFGYDRNLDDVSNVRDLREMQGVYFCEDPSSDRIEEPSTLIAIAGAGGGTVVALLLILAISATAFVVWLRSTARRRRDP